jgi:hypothetical protein
VAEETTRWVGLHSRKEGWDATTEEITTWQESHRLGSPGLGNTLQGLETYKDAFSAMESFEKDQADQSGYSYYMPNDPRGADTVKKSLAMDPLHPTVSTTAGQQCDEKRSYGFYSTMDKTLAEQRQQSLGDGPYQRYPRMPINEEDEIPHPPTPPTKPTGVVQKEATPGITPYTKDAPLQQVEPTGNAAYPSYQGRYSPRFPTTEDGYIPYPPMEQQPMAIPTTTLTSVAARYQSSADESEDDEVEQRNLQSLNLPQFKTPETDDDDLEGNHPPGSNSSTASHPQFTEISHYTNQADTSSMGNDLSMETAEEQGEEESSYQGPIIDTTDDVPEDSDFEPQEDEDDASEATEPQSNSIPVLDTLQDNDNSSDDSSGSEDLEEEAERET